jgi:hypothetical protein
MHHPLAFPSDILKSIITITILNIEGVKFVKKPKKQNLPEINEKNGT